MSGRPPTHEPLPPLCKLLHLQLEILCLLLCRIITKLCVNFIKVWSNHCDGLMKDDFIATSTNYSTHLSCFVSIK